MSGFFRFSTVLLGLALACMSTSSARGQAFVLEFGGGGRTTSDGTAFITNATPNSVVSLDLFLTQTGGESRLNNLGVFVADMNVTVSGGSDISNAVFVREPSFAAEIGNAANGLNFDRLLVGAPGPPGPPGVFADATVDTDPPTVDNSVLLGTFSYTLGATATGPITVTAAATSNDILSVDTFQLGGFQNIVVNSGMATINVIAVPEPAMVGALAVGAIAIGCRYRKRRVKPTGTQRRA